MRVTCFPGAPVPHKDYFGEMDMMDRAVVFDDWEAVLQAEVSPELHRPYREAIVKFRYWLRQTGKPATVAAFKEHLAWKKSYLPPDKFALRREALRWYHREGMLRMRPAIPQAGAATRNPGAAIAQPEEPRPPVKINTAQAKPASAAPKHEPLSCLPMNDVPTRGAADLGGPP